MPYYRVTRVNVISSYIDSSIFSCFFLLQNAFSQIYAQKKHYFSDSKHFHSRRFDFQHFFAISTIEL